MCGVCFVLFMSRTVCGDSDPHEKNSCEPGGTHARSRVRISRTGRPVRSAAAKDHLGRTDRTGYWLVSRIRK